MKRWSGALCLLLAALMIFMVLPADAVGFEADEETPEDLVIVLDCSMSLGFNDPQNLCLESLKNFIDKLPVRNARISVIAFGYANENPYEKGDLYEYKTELNVPNNRDAKLVHLIVPLDFVGEKKDTDRYKESAEHAILSNRANHSTWTPIGHALTAAVDMLLDKGAKEDKACIIVVSDGVNDPKTDYDAPLIQPASETAGEHNWPVYCIELNYNNNSPAEVKDAQALLREICETSGNTTVGMISCETPSDVHCAFNDIFNDFYHRNSGKSEEVTIKPDVPGEYIFDTPDLTSECNVDIFGVSVQHVELYRIDGGSDQLIIDVNADVQTENIMAEVEEGSYYSIKMLNPDPGKWKVKIYGETEAKVTVTNSNLQEMFLTMNAVPSEGGGNLTKSGTISVTSSFEYHGTELHGSRFYKQNPATLAVHCPGEENPRKYVMDATEDAYCFELPLSDIPSGDIYLQVVLEHEMFRTGRRVSPSVQFHLDNIPLEAKDAKPFEQHTFLNRELVFTDMEQYFRNPDGDPISYQVVCTNDPDINFACEAEGDDLKINSGLKTGTFEVEIQAKDPDMESYVSYSGTIIVNNSDMTTEEIPDQQLWLDRYPHQKDTRMEMDLNLNDYFQDPDQLPITYTVSMGEQVAEITQKDAALHIQPSVKGKTVVTVTASDGYSEQTQEFQLTVTSGKTVFWQHNWIYFALAAALLIFLVISLIVILKNKRVKGEWDITFEENGLSATLEDVDINAFTNAGRKPRFLLQSLVSELVVHLDAPLENLHMTAGDYFIGTGAEKIELCGVFGKRGMVIRKVPKGAGSVVVTCNGQIVAGKAKLKNGNLAVQITRPDGSGPMSITFYLR